MSAPYEATLHDLSDPEARAAYARLYECSPQRTPFASLAMAEAACAAYGLAGRIVSVADADGAWRAALIVFEKRRGPFRIAALPPLVLYVAPVLDGLPEEAEIVERRGPLDALLALLAARYDRAALLLPPAFSDVRPFGWAGWTLTPRYTYLGPLDADPPARWSRKRRWLARKSGPDFQIEEGSGNAELALTLMASSHHRKRVPFDVNPVSTRALVRALTATGMVRAFAAVPSGLAGGASRAAAAVLVDGSTAYYWLAGAAPGAASTALLASALPRLHADGLVWMDWLGANVPSVAAFKRSLGPTLALGFEARLVCHPALRLIEQLRNGTR